MTLPRWSWRVLVLALVPSMVAACGSDDDAAVGEASEATTPAVAADSDASDQGREPAGDDQDGARGGEGDDHSGSATAQALAPLAGLDRLAGGSFDLTTLGEGPVVVWFWAPWCPNCRAMAPDLAAVAAEYGDRVDFVGVAGRGERDEMDEFVSSTGSDGLVHVVDDDGSAWAAFGVVSQPALALVGADGSVELVSGVQRRDALNERLADLLDS
jgi:thiol-disulfide isomerase/thioredoxin